MNGKIFVPRNLNSMSSSAHNVSSTPLTKVVVEIAISHPHWEGDGRDEKLAVDNIRDVLSDLKGYGTFRIVDVETR